MESIIYILNYYTLPFVIDIDYICNTKYTFNYYSPKWKGIYNGRVRLGPREVLDFTSFYTYLMSYKSHLSYYLV